MINNKGSSTSLPSNIISFDAASLIKFKLSDDLLSRLASSGSLRSSSCRSAVWRFLLRCLPYEVSDWEVVLSRNRNSYRFLKKKNLIDPHDEQFSQDPQLNNPLAPVEQNPWNSFFEDNELRDIIGKDVARTFPEIEFFQQDNIRQMMADILLVYAKENPFVSYKQGMHEILAPLIFVIFSDIEAYQHAKEKDELKTLTLQEEDLLNCLFCKDFLEHDSYNLFCAFMLEVAKWYEDTTNSENHRVAKEPYLRVQDQTSNTRLMEDLIDIGNLLQEIDPTLSKHLNNLDIPPQLYGIRWLRLLFGRELPLHDLLYLWDIILIDRPIGPLVKCVFVSMLVQIRHLLLNNDYGGCLQYLMRYPPIADIDSFIKLARHYRNPKKIARPAIRENNFTHITVAGKNHPNRTQRPGKSLEKVKNTPTSSQSPPSILTFVPVLEKMKISMRDRSNTVSVPSSPRKDAKDQKSEENAQKAMIWGKQIQIMEEQVSCLQIKLNEQDMLCSQVSKSLEIYAEEIRNAQSAQQCQQLAEQLIQLSKILVSSQSMSSKNESDKSRLENYLKPLPSIHQNNEMVDLTTTTINKQNQPKM